MTTRKALIVGGIVGLIISSAVLTLLWFGVVGILNVGDANLMYVFWPSSMMLLVGWRSTIHGIVFTTTSIAINCLMYMALSYALLRIGRLVRS
jgi:hypothetical protein